MSGSFEGRPDHQHLPASAISFQPLANHTSNSQIAQPSPISAGQAQALNSNSQQCERASKASFRGTDALADILRT
jgi:hypothetical protein